jgi:sarcosine oxidase, subunit delta
MEVVGMLMIPCPYCGLRPELEFVYAGEAHLVRPENPAEFDDDQWAGFLYFRTNAKGRHFERWRHIHGCARFFNAIRDTIKDQFLATYEIGAPKPDLDAQLG